MRKTYTSLLCVLLALLLCACKGEIDDSVPPPEEEAQPFVLSVSIPYAPDAAQSSETVLVHLRENLMRWSDGGDGWAVLAPGLAESYAVETDYLGNATYTFTLREGIRWSGGESITASDFVRSWQALADGESPHRSLLDCVARLEAAAAEDEADVSPDNAEEIGEGSEEPAPLALSAPDERTFVVTLTGDPAYFLEEVCASVYTAPAGESSGGSFSGPYVLGGENASHIVLVRNEQYYAPDPAGPEEIHFYAAGEAEAAYEQLMNGSLDLITALPADVLKELADSGLWTPEPVTDAWGVLLNTRRAPFDNENIRMAFHLAVDRRKLVEALGDPTARPTAGVVPYGVSDYGPRPAVEVDAEDTLPDPNAEPQPEKPAPTCWDFRSHSLEMVTAEHEHDYDTDRSYAQALLANAGYPGGNGFPAVEYLYVKDAGAGEEMARLLQEMWKESLGVSVRIRGVTQGEYDAALASPPPEENGDEGETEAEEEPIPLFQMAAQELAPPYSDAGALLERWYSESGENASGYASDAFDILLRSARAAISPAVRDAYLHDAEAILLGDSPVIPVYCLGGSYRLADGLAGLYRASDGVFFLHSVHRGNAAG